MQTLGTEWGRQAIHPNIWVHAWEQYANRYSRQCCIVVDDIRFLNEMGTIRKRGGRIIEIRRSGATAGDFSHHKSEHEWRDGPIDTVILNDGTLLELESKIVKELGLTDAVEQREPLGAK